MCPQEIIQRITAASPIAVRLYAAIRFKIIRPILLEELARNFPSKGTVLDLGCGFGLFTLYMAMLRPDLEFAGIDIDANWIANAAAMSERLGLRNVRFVAGDLQARTADRPAACAYAIDLFHHIPRATGNTILKRIRDELLPGGCFLLKEVDTRPLHQLWLCHLTDLVTAPGTRVHYRSAAEWEQQLRDAGFDSVTVRPMNDRLPYPHVLLVSSKRERETTAG